LPELKRAVLEGEDDLALSLARKALEEGTQPMTVVNEAIVPGIQEAGIFLTSICGSRGWGKACPDFKKRTVYR